MELHYQKFLIKIDKTLSKNWLKWAFKTAKEHAEKEMAQHKHYHDHKMCCMRLEVGDQVLVHIKAFGTDHKIAGKWENDPYIVEECMTGKPVYNVKPV